MASPYEAKDTSPLKSKRTVEEFYSSGAPDHLLDPITFIMFRNPVVAPSGETYEVDTIVQSGGQDPTTREAIPDPAKLPPNRAIKRQVDKYIQEKIETIASRIEMTTMPSEPIINADGSPASRIKEQIAAERELPAERYIAQAARILQLSVGRSDDCILNGKRALCMALDHVAPFTDKVRDKVDPDVLVELDAALVALGEGDLGEKLIPGISNKRAQKVAAAAAAAASSLSEAMAGARLSSSREQGGGARGPEPLTSSGRGQVRAAAGAAGGDPADVCRRCSMPVSRAHAETSEDGEIYHPACFSCKVCSKPLAGGGKHGVHAGEVMCTACITDLVCEPCVACGKGVSAGVRHGGRLYHHACDPGEAAAAAAAAAAAGGGGGDGPGVCKRCEKQIHGEYFHVLGGTYHPDCLTCRQCDFPLEGSDEIRGEEGEEPLCGDCYAFLHLPRCGAGGPGGCGKPVKEGIKALDRTWCAACWKCGLCSDALPKSFRKNKEGALPLCEKCYTTTVLPRCHECGRPAEEWVTAESVNPGKKWHKECFMCSSCQAVLQGKFHHKGISLFCEACYKSHFMPPPPKCAECALPIDGEALSALDRLWHPSCFKCLHCSAVVGAVSFHKSPGPDGMGDRPVCDACFEARLPRCFVCRKPLKEGAHAVYKGTQMHTQCFKCCKCSAVLGAKFYETKSGQECEKCAETRMRIFQK